MTTIRAQHWTDEAGGLGQRRRTIQNWSNYKTAAGVWAPTTLDIRQATTETFLGRALEWIAEEQPLQWFVGDSSEAGGRPWFGVRRADQPDTGIVSFMVNGDASAGYAVNGQEKSGTWLDVLPDTNMKLQLAGHRIDRVFELTSGTAGEGGHGDRVTLGFIMPDGWSVEVENNATNGNRLLFKRPNGNVVLRSLPARAWDSSTAGLDGEGADVPCGFIDRGTDTLGPYTYFKIEKRCQPSGFQLPVFLDDSIEIDKSDGIEDSYISSSAPTTKYGNSTLNYFKGNGSTYELRSICRIADIAVLPSGSYTSAEFSHVIGDKVGTVLYHSIADANDWNKTNVTWNETNTGVPWAGSNGGMTSGTDYDASTIGSQVMTNTVTWKRFDVALTASLFEDWRDSNRDNNGFFASIVYNDTFAYRSVEYATQAERPYFTIEYDSGAPHYYNMLNKGRR